MQKLTRVSGETLDVAPLTFCVKSIQRQRSFAATAHSTDNRKLPKDDIEVDPLEVVLPSSSQGDELIRIVQLEFTNLSEALIIFGVELVLSRAFRARIIVSV